ncbi:hypothetical protein [Specibacter sp. NPDC078692]|uniref:hypothetical protein n=1 Tax=Specibacter sp. NPDC078692 TaxID=3155818 RepID=UPI00341DC422
MSKSTLIGPHGIDLRSPGGIEQLFAFNRRLFGNAVMQDDGGAGAGGAAGAGAGAPAGGEGAGDGAGAEGAAAGAGGADGDEQLGEGGKKALVAERATAAALKAANVTLLAENQKLKDATLTEEQKRDAKLASLESGTTEQTVTIASQASMLLRYEIAEAKGLDLAAAKRLVGSTREELEKDADDFKTKFVAPSTSNLIPGAGARGSSQIETSPGMGTLRAGYAETSK